jgi:hypothetical protein
MFVRDPIQPTEDREMRRFAAGGPGTTMLKRAGRPRGERKPLEESPDTTGQGGGLRPPGETRGKVPQKHTADGAATRELRTGKGEKVR